MLISVITPCRNEAAFIGKFVESLLQQERTGFDIEILIAEGRSDDGTAVLLTSLAERYPQVRVIDNPRRIVSTGLNRAIEAAQGDIIVRMDVHTHYERDYVTQCVQALMASNAGCVGGPWRAVGEGLKQEAIVDAFQSRIGSGGAISRRLDYNGPCDTVYLGCWWKKDLVEIGGFDDGLVRNQDDELCLRMKLAGRTIWQSSKIRSQYAPRSSFKALARQFFQYGYWKVAVARKHRQHASLRHLTPFLFVTILALLAIGGLVTKIGLYLLLSYVAAYAITVLAVSALASRRKDPMAIAHVFVAIACMHIAYGLGYALGVRDFWLSGRSGREKMAALTR